VKLVLGLCLISLVAASLFSFNTIPSVIAWGAKTKPQGSGAGVTVGKSGEPFIKLLQGNDLSATFTGPPDAEAALNGNQADPVSATAAGGNLVVGYTSPKGNWLAVLPGNVDSIFSNSPEAQRRKAEGKFVDAPFLRSARAIVSPVKPDFLEAGDFNNDGFTDLVAASLKGDQLFLLPGNDGGDFESGVWSSIDLPGNLTALAAGKVNRDDGLTSLVVATAGISGNFALVFQNPLGAFNGTWESFRLSGEATSIALSQLDRNDSWGDIILSTGSSLSIIHGRDRKLYLDDRVQRNVPAPVIEQRSFPFAISAVEAGDFTSDPRVDIAMLASDGSVHLLYQGTSADTGLQAYSEKRLGAGAWPGATKLSAAPLSSVPRDSLVISDPVNQALEILTDGTPPPNAEASRPPANWPDLVSATLNVAGGARAALPLRMTRDSLEGLVVLRSGRSAPTVVLPSAVMTFTVTNTNDSGAGSLRQAILDSNTNAGADTIAFSIGSGPQTIAPIADLPPVNDAVTIDATTQPGFSGTPLITLSGAGTGSGLGLKIAAGTTTVRGLVVNNCSLNAIEFIINGNNHLEGCYIGTDATGSAAVPNFDGVKVFSISGCIIGGTTAAARNVISGNNDAGVDVAGVSATGNTVQGNYIGTNAAGTAALPNVNNGVYVNSKLTKVGGLTAAERNIISGNAGNGVVILNDNTITGTLVQGNYIGLDAGGAAAVPNGLSGVRVLNTSNHSIGGAATGAGNLISGNTGSGVFISDLVATGNVIEGNLIGGFGIGNGGKGILINLSSGNTVGGTGPASANGLHWNADDGIAITAATANRIRRNSIVGNGGLGIDLDDDGVTPNDLGDPDAGANNRQNFPVLAQTKAGASTTIMGTLNSTPNSSFVIEFYINGFCDASGSGEGFVLMGETNVTTNASGNAPFSTTLAVASSAGQFITATAANLSNSDTSEFSPCSPVCGFSIAPPSQSFTPAGGTGSIAVTTGGSCNWTAVSSAAFVTITSGASGTGSGTVNFSVAGNTTVNPRTATITVEDQVFTINQAGCTYAIAPPSQSFTSAGGTGSITVTAPGICPWTAVSSAAFVTITSGASGAGNGTVNFSVAGNTSVNPRNATITVVDQVFNITQAGCTYAIAPPNQTFTSAAGTGSITVTTTATCPWTAVSGAAFVTITSGASGTGNGTVNFSVTANPSSVPRSTTITVVDQIFTVNQDGAPCTFSILPTSQSFSAAGGTGSVAVTAVIGCAWTAVSNDGFITVTSGASGTGNGTVNYSVAPKGDVGSRMGTITIAGQTFTVTQAGTDCSILTIMPTNQSFPLGGGTGSVAVTTGAGCMWTAASNAAFITITSGASGTGNGTVNYSVAANPDPNPRSGTMTIGGQIFTVNQAGACPLTISPTGKTFLAAGGTATITVTTDPTCFWTAVSNVAWITITSGSSGTGNGMVRYSVAPNGSGVQRIGMINVSGKIHTVKQN
jgi:hypothetical protein